MRAVLLPLIVAGCLTGIGCSANVREAARRSDADAAVTATEEGFESAPAEASSPEDLPIDREFNTEAYDHIVENAFLAALQNPLSTFSIDVDTASYSNVRRFLTHGSLPPAGAVRIEELINYFSYDYEGPRNSEPFAVNAEAAGCPWAPEHRLLRIGLKGREIETRERPASNLVFLVDVSGSMDDPNKLPLVKRSLQRLVEELDGADQLAIVTYAGSSRVALEPTPADEKHFIATAIERLDAGGSTHGSEGIRTAYKLARQHYLPNGTNRVLLCTDGDFNVGVTSQSELVDLIRREAESGVFLSVLGFGMGNYKDSTVEKLADQGNGNYAYIDTFAEARKVLVDQLSGTLVTIAKDVKIQVEFNPAAVSSYRLIGYENRKLAAEDFRDDAKDAGEIGAGHTVTALYEIVPAGAADNSREVAALRYQRGQELSMAAATGELATLRLRYKEPAGSEGREMEFRIEDSGKPFERASGDFQFAAAVAGYGMLLRDSEHKGNATWEGVLEWAGPAADRDSTGYRAEFLQLVQTARSLQPRQLSEGAASHRIR
jgi:Ca-activated chloride channel family protein